MSTITNFAELGYNVDEAIAVLIDLGIIESESDLTDAQKSELQSLALVSNLVLLDAISDKSAEIEARLQGYDVSVSKLSAMQEFLTLMHEKVDQDGATINNLFEFIETEKTVIDQLDTTAEVINYTLEWTDPYGTTYQVTYETLADYIEALESNAQAAGGDSIMLATMLRESAAGNIDNILTSDGEQASSIGRQEVVEDFKNGDAWLYIQSDSNEAYDVAMGYDDYLNYLIALAMQDAGYLGEELSIKPTTFCVTNPNVFDENNVDESGNFYNVSLYGEVQVYEDQTQYGKFAITRDSANQTVSVDYNGGAILAEMGIDLSGYSEISPTDENEFDDAAFWRAFDRSGIGSTSSSNRWDELDGRDLTSGSSSAFGPWFSDASIDILMEATATSIESQSTRTEVKLLTVTSNIDEWGEQNHVWDMVHEIVHDARKRAHDNTL